ncbi:MAG TPA: peptide ABC transporter substrate-binding protein [Candidatus Elarobacter sp.]|nr:peptide ABC transporter substrate-binding protein [Candidatus Elarobacter sp.]
MNKAVALVLTALLLGGCTKVGPVASSGGGGTGDHNAYTVPHELRIGDIQDITSLNPHLASAASLGNLSQMTMAYLVRYDSDNRAVPELATVVPSMANGGVSKDGRTITWHLRRGVKWSDGVPFDADDMVWSTNAVNNPKNNEIGRDGWDLITKIDEPDKYTVVYHLKKPYSGFLPTFFGSAGANPCILPKHLLAKLPNFNNADYNNKPVGIGPFRYVRWVRSDHVELEPNPYYWRGVPKLKRVIYRFIPDRNTLLTQLQTGEIDLWPSVGAGYFDRMAALPNITAIHHPSYYYSHVDFEIKHPVFADPAVRQALEYATDRPTILAKIAHGYGTLSETQVTPVSPFHVDHPLLPFDVAKANAILDAAGWVRGGDGVRAKNGVRLTPQLVIYTGAPDTDQLVELLRQEWAQIGVRIDVKHVSQQLFFAPAENGGPIFAGRYDVTSFSWGATPDEDYTPEVNCDGVPPNGENVTRVCDPVLQSLTLQEKAAYDEAQRKAVIAKLDDRLAQLKPYFVLYIRDDLHGFNKDLRGWHPNSSTPFDDMMNVDI